MLAYIDFPSWLKPEVFGFLNLPAGNFLNVIRWYGLMYIIGIVISYFQSMYLLKNDNFKTLNKKLIDDYYFWAVIGLILGGRIFSCLIYDFGYYSQHPFQIIFPFRDGQFIGFQGMAYHGAVIGVFTASVIFAKKKKLIFRELCDLVFPIIPLGYTFGRLGNFINSELYGRITAMPFAIFFPNADKVPLNSPETQKVIQQLGWKVDEGVNSVITAKGAIIPNALGKVISEKGVLTDLTGINLPRHPSQLYEAFFEGIVLFLILWFPARKFKPFKGFLASVYLVGYGLFRIFLEFFRQPDIQFSAVSAGKYTGFIIGIFSMGQILSFLMILVGIGVGWYFYSLSQNELVSAESNKFAPPKKHKKKNKKRR